MSKPSFLASKGQRAEAAAVIDTTDIMRHYRNILRGSSQWEGLPEDMPVGYIEDTALWYAGGFAVKKCKGIGLAGFPCNPVTLDVYGQPVDWLPSIINGVSAYRESDDIYKEANTPVLWLGTPLRDQIKPYAQLMAQVLRTLGQNLMALSHPIMVSGRPSGQPGDNISALLLKADLETGQLMIPVVEGSGVPLEVLDLRARDNTQNLISTLSACDAKILEILQTSNGIEKSSGITTAETETGSMPLQYNQGGYDELCDIWAERTNAVLGTNIRHKRREIEQPTAAMPGEGEGDQEESEDDSDKPE